MLKKLIKKRLSEEKVANVFVNSIIHSVEQAFPEVAALINEDPAFERSPQVGADNMDKFLLVVFAGNLKLIPDHFESYQDMRIMDQIYRKMSTALGLELETTKRMIGSYQNFCSRMNHPSKNVLYSMSKGVFFKYELSPYQTEYFRNMKAPDPIFLKRLDEVMEHFIFDWEAFRDKYRITE